MKKLGKQQTCDVINSGTNNFILKNGVVTHNSLLGYNLYSAVIDEANFLEVVEGSKKTDKYVYDAAEAMYNATYNRMVSRFMRGGKVPGFIVMISSRKNKKTFMEKKIKEAIINYKDPENGIFFRVKSLWQAKPKEYFPSNEYFYIDTETFKVIDPKLGEPLYNLQKKLIKNKIEVFGPEPEYIGLY